MPRGVGEGQSRCCKVPAWCQREALAWRGRAQPARKWGQPLDHTAAATATASWQIAVT